MWDIYSPWEIEKKMFETIRTHFPDISWELYEVFDNWWDNQVVMLDNHLIFRFPRNEQAKITQQKERYLLNLVKKYVDIAIPQYTFFSPDNSCVGYSAIRWLPMTIEIYNNLSDNIKLKVQQQLANFLTQLHSIPIKELEKIGYIRQKGTSNEWSQNFQRDFIQTCWKYFTKKEIQIIVDYIQELQKLDFEYKVLTHSDVQEKNIFMDNELTHIAGIIDFSDARIADPALDFDTLLDYWEDLVFNVYKNYQGRKDSDLLKRAKFYKKRWYLYSLIHAIEKQKDIEQNLELFRSTFF